MLPAVMRWNKPVNAERQALVAAAMGHPGRGRRRCARRASSPVSACRAASRAVRIGPESFDRIAEGAMETPWVPRNPRPIAGPAQVREILELAA